MLPTIEVMAFKSSKALGASHQAHKATVHQQGLLAVLAHHPAPEGSQDILVLRQLTFLSGLQDHVATQHVGGAL